MKVPHLVVLLLLATASACSDSHPSLLSPPMSPSTPPVTPTPSSSLLGYAHDAAFRTVAGALVEVLDGPQTGASVTSGPDGRFTLTGSFANPWTLRITKDGFRPLTMTTGFNGYSPIVSARLEAVAAPVGLAGEYTMTLQADDTCVGLPSDVRTRTYVATIGPASDPQASPGTSLTLTATGARFLPTFDSFQVGVAGADVGFMLYHGEDWGLVEQAAPDTFIAIAAEGVVSVPGSIASSIALSIDGSLEYCVLRPGAVWNRSCQSSSTLTYQACPSSHPRLTLERR